MLKFISMELEPTAYAMTVLQSHFQKKKKKKNTQKNTHIHTHLDNLFSAYCKLKYQADDQVQFASNSPHFVQHSRYKQLLLLNKRPKP